MNQVAPAEVPLPSQKHFVFVGSTGFCCGNVFCSRSRSRSLALSLSLSRARALSLFLTHTNTHTHIHAQQTHTHTHMAALTGSFRWTLFAGNVSIDDTYVVNPFKDPFEASFQVPHTPYSA